MKQKLKKQLAVFGIAAILGVGAGVGVNEGFMHITDASVESALVKHQDKLETDEARRRALTEAQQLVLDITETVGSDKFTAKNAETYKSQFAADNTDRYLTEIHESGELMLDETEQAEWKTQYVENNAKLKKVSRNIMAFIGASMGLIGGALGNLGQSRVDKRQVDDENIIE